jgi:hypothetical protein
MRITMWNVEQWKHRGETKKKWVPKPLSNDIPGVKRSHNIPTAAVCP